MQNFVFLVLVFGLCSTSHVVQSENGTLDTTSNIIKPVQDQFLVRFVQNAVVNHPRIRAEKASVDAKSALKRAAGYAIYNPELDFDVESASDDTYSMGVSQTIDISNKRSARIGVAESEYSLSTNRLAVVRKSVAINILMALADFHSENQQFDLADRRLVLVTKFSELANRRYRAGDLNQTELNLANLALVQAQIKLATQQSTLAEASQELQLQSQKTDTFNWPKLPTRLPNVVADQGALHELVLSLPEVQTSQTEVNIFKERINLRQRERKPDPTIGIRGGQEASDTLVGVTLTIPLFVRNSFSEEVVAAQSELYEAEFQFQNAFNKASARLISSTKRYRSTQDAWRNWKSSGQLSQEKQAELLERLWEAGELSTTDYLVQLNHALDTQASATDLQQQLWASWFDWLSASDELRNWLTY